MLRRVLIIKRPSHRNYGRVFGSVLFFLAAHTPVICLIESSETYEYVYRVLDHRPSSDERIYEIKIKSSDKSPVQTSDDHEQASEKIHSSHMRKEKDKMCCAQKNCIFFAKLCKSIHFLRSCYKTQGVGY